jgi:tripartite-type tricarboxylate transporter receptor subunit TctC
VSFGTTAVGGEAHLSMEYIKALGRVDMTHVPYKGGGPATTDLVGNHIPMLVLPVSTVMEHVNKGSVKILGVIFPRRFAGLPNVPTVAESLPGFQSSGSWIGALGPANLPAPIVNRWHAFIAQTLNERETREKLESIGQFVLVSTPKELSEQINASMGLYEKLVKAAGIQPE